MNAQLDANCDLAKIDLTGDGKRAAVQAITAARHKKLLQALKDAKSEDDKVEAAKKLEENYRAHYAIETAWREERIAELEKRIEEMRSQVKERATSEDKYVEAAMTLAKLHAQGISAEPPVLIAPERTLTVRIHKQISHRPCLSPRWATILRSHSTRIQKPRMFAIENCGSLPAVA